PCTARTGLLGAGSHIDHAESPRLPPHCIGANNAQGFGPGRALADVPIGTESSQDRRLAPSIQPATVFPVASGPPRPAAQTPNWASGRTSVTRFYGFSFSRDELTGL